MALRKKLLKENRELKLIIEAYLNQGQYDRRRENAVKRNMNNEEIAIDNGMTEEQAELITELCSMRHDFHSNLDSIVRSDENGYKKDLVELNSRMEEENISMDFIPDDETDYIDIDTISELKDYGLAPDIDDEDYDEWFDEEYSNIYSELENLNKQIENFLGEIDSKYGTTFKPTGSLRNL